MKIKSNWCHFQGLRVVNIKLNPSPFPLKLFILLPTLFLIFWQFNIFVFLTSVYNLFLELNFVLWSDGFHPIFANLTFTLGTLTGYLLNCRPNWFIMKPFLCNWKIHKSLILNNLKNTYLHNSANLPTILDTKFSI